MRLFMDRFFKFLNSDRYQYTESEIYLENNMQNQTAVFDVFLRTQNKNGYAIVYGISDVLELIEILNETSYEDRKKYLSELSDNEEKVDTTVYNAYTIEQVMAKNPVGVSPDQTVRDVTEILSKQSFHSLPVVENGELKGVITTTDLLKYFLEQY